MLCVVWCCARLGRGLDVAIAPSRHQPQLRSAPRLTLFLVSFLAFLSFEFLNSSMTRFS